MPSSTSDPRAPIPNTLDQLTAFLADALPYALGAVALLLIFSLADRHRTDDALTNHPDRKKSQAAHPPPKDTDAD